MSDNFQVPEYRHQQGQIYNERLNVRLIFSMQLERMHAARRHISDLPKHTRHYKSCCTCKIP